MDDEPWYGRVLCVLLRKFANLCQLVIFPTLTWLAQVFVITYHQVWSTRFYISLLLFYPQYIILDLFLSSGYLQFPFNILVIYSINLNKDLKPLKSSHKKQPCTIYKTYVVYSYLLKSIIITKPNINRMKTIQILKNRIDILNQRNWQSITMFQGLHSL